MFCGSNSVPLVPGVVCIYDLFTVGLGLTSMLWCLTGFVVLLGTTTLGWDNEKGCEGPGWIGTPWEGAVDEKCACGWAWWMLWGCGCAWWMLWASGWACGWVCCCRRVGGWWVG